MGSRDSPSDRCTGCRPIDEAPRAAVGRASLLALAFGCFFFDYHLDGHLDLFAVNGHVADDVEEVQSRVTYAQPPHLFRSLADGNFEEVTVGDGPPRWLLVNTGSRYASQSELVLTFGLGAAAAADIVRVVWPSGQIDTVMGVAANQQITIREGDGIVEASPLGY